MNLYDKLRKIGFTSVVTPITKFQTLLNRFYKTPRYVPTMHKYWVEKVIMGIKYEVYEIDEWYCQLRVGGLVMFDKRRFNDDELLGLIPFAVKTDNFLNV